MANTAIRGVYPEYGFIRNEVPSDGRWISPEDFQERRRVVFLGARLRQKLFAGRPAVGEVVRIQGMRFTVIGSMDRKFQMRTTSRATTSAPGSLTRPPETCGTCATRGCWSSAR